MCIITATPSRKPPGMPHNRPISFSGADYLPPNKTAPGPVCDRNAVPPRIAFIVNAPQRPPNALPTLCTTYYPKARQPRARIHEYQPNRRNIQDFNNIRMVNLLNVGVPWSQSLKSLTSLKGFKVSCSLFKFIVDVDCSC